LDDAHEYRHGSVSPEFFRGLVVLLREPWQPFVFAGRGACGMCRFSGGPGALVYDGEKVSMGTTNLFVPAADRRVFVAPSLIAHYVDAHDYCPPDEFQAAVVACPPMGSLPYRRALHERGVRMS
jgi:hypothetical protein